MDSVDFYDHERKLLREKLHDVKNCRITFVTTSVVATGVLLGIAAALASTPALAVIFFFPWIVSLPSWWILFDKAITITRIVRYCEILENGKVA